MMQDLLFVSALPTETQSGGGAYSRAIIDALHQWRGQEHVFICEGEPIKHPRRARFFSVVESIFSSLPSKAIYAKRSGLLRKLPHTSRLNSMIVSFNGPDAFGVVAKECKSHKTISIAHNIEADTFENQVRREGALVRFLFRTAIRDVAKLRKLEIAYFDTSDAVIAISQADADWILQRFPGKPVFVAPPTFPYQPGVRDRVCTNKKIRLGFVGKMGWWPNQHGVDWFLKEVFPSAPKLVEFHLFGPGSERYTSPDGSIFGHGFLPDVAEVWGGADIFVCPIFEGGGANVKLAEAIYNGVPVITTPFAAKGLGLLGDNRAGLKQLNDAGEWRRFVKSDELLSLANSVVDPSLSQCFSRANNVRKLIGWLSEQFGH